MVAAGVAAENAPGERDSSRLASEEGEEDFEEEEGEGEEMDVDE